MNEYERYMYYRNRQQTTPTAGAPQRYKNIESADKYIMQRHQLLELLEGKEKIIIDSSDFESLVERAAAAIRQAIK